MNANQPQTTPSYRPLQASVPPQSQSSYPLEMVQPMRDELTGAGVVELLSEQDVERELAGSGTAVVIINSVCGCAAGAARPGFTLALEQCSLKPDKALTAFAGVHKEAVNAVRSRVPAPPSSPCIVLFKDGKAQAMMHRSDIEVRNPEQVAAVLDGMFKDICV